MYFLCHQITYIFHDGATYFPVFAEKTQQTCHFQVYEVCKKYIKLIKLFLVKYIVWNQIFPFFSVSV